MLMTVMQTPTIVAELGKIWWDKSLESGLFMDIAWHYEKVISI